MKRKNVSILLIIILFTSFISEIIPIYGTGNLGTFIDFSNSNTALAYSSQRKLNYDGTYWWAGYYNGSQTELAYSSDKITWHPGIAVWNSSITSPSDIHVYNNTLIFACVTYKTGIDDYILFRKGTISGNSITWNSIRTVTLWSNDFNQHFFACSVTYDGSVYAVAVSNYQGNNVAKALRSTDGGVTWGNSLIEGNPTVGTIILSMTGNKEMLLRRYFDNVNPLDNRMFSYIYSAGWGAQTYVSADNIGFYNDDKDAGFSAITDSSNSDIIHVAYLKRNTDPPAVITYSLQYVKYQAGWQAPVNIINGVSATSYPTISTDDAGNVIIGFMNNSLAYTKTLYASNSSFGSQNLIGNPSTPINGYLIGEERESNFAIDYMIENGAGVPYNVTLLTLSYPLPPPPYK